MAEKSSFFTSLNGDRKYKASDFAEYFKTFIGNGVFPNPSSNLQVISNGDMTLTISPGFAWINGYMYNNTDNLILTVDHSDSALKRIDRVIIKCDFINREIKTYIKTGVFSESPTAPMLTRDSDAYELCIAEIQIDNGVVSIQQSSITDTRLNNEVCGIVTQTVNEIDTTTLFNQIEAYKKEFELQNTNWFNATTVKLGDDFNTWFNTVKGILNEDVAGNLTNRVMALEDKVNNLDLVASKVTMNDGSTVEETVSANKTSIHLANENISALQEELGTNKSTLKQILIDKKIEGLENENRLSVLIDKVNLLNDYSSKFYLYNEGDECISLTGGWKATFTHTNASFAKYSNYMYLNCPNGNGTIQCGMVNTIKDMSSYSNICINYEYSSKASSGTYFQVRYTPNQTIETNIIAKYDIESGAKTIKGTKKIPISGLSNNNYLTMYLGGWGSSSAYVKIYEVWLEK